MANRTGVLQWLVETRATGANIHLLRNLLGAAMLASSLGDEREFDDAERQIFKLTRY
jgi:hypothetical protein